MATFTVNNKTELESACGSAASGDTIYLNAGTYTNVRISSRTFSTTNPLLITLAPGVTQTQVVFTGGQASQVNACLNGETENTIDDNNPAIRFSNCVGIIFNGPEVKDAGRGVHVTGGHHVTVRNCFVHRVLDRAIGGPTDDLTVEDCVVDQAALENYESRLFFATGGGGGWPGIIATYRDEADGNRPAYRFTVRRCIVTDSWGEAIAPFHCNGGTIEDNIVIDGSHTVGIYLEQCQGFTTEGNFIIATSNAPVRHDGRVMHGILIAREGTSFAPPLTDMVIYDNVINGTAAGIRGWNDVNDLLEVEITYNTVVNCDTVNYDAIDFEQFQTTPTVLIDHNIIEGMTIDDTAGFTITNNWFIGTIPGYVGAGNFNSPVPSFADDGNEVDPGRGDYVVTNMPAEHYGALVFAENPEEPDLLTTSSYSTGNTNSLTLDVPPGATGGNQWLLAAIAARRNISNSTITPPVGSDWVLRASLSPPTAGSAGRVDVYAKQCTGSEPADYTWGIDVATAMCGIMRVVQDIDINNAIVSLATANGELTNQATGAAVNTSQNNAPVYYIGMVNSSSTDFGTIDGFGKITEVECDGGVFLSCAMFSQIKATAGSTGPITSTLTDGTKEFAIVTMAFGVPAPSSGGGAPPPDEAAPVAPTAGSVLGSGVVFVDARERVRVDLLDYNGNPVGTTDNFTSLNFTIKASDKGDMQINLPFENPLYPLLRPDYIFQIWYKWPERNIGWINVFNGINKTEVRTQAENGRRTFAGYAPSEEELLDKTYIMYAAGSAQTKKSAVSSTVMYAFTRENIGALATIANGRVLAGVNPVLFGADFAVGPVWSGERAYKNLLAVLREIRQFSIDRNDQIDFKVTYQNGYYFLFEAGDIYTDRTATGVTATSQGLNAAGNAPVVFAPRYGNLRRMTVSESRYNEANVVVALGPGEQSSRLYGIASNGASRATSPISQREMVVSATNQSAAAELNAVAQARLDELTARKKVSAVPRDSSQILWRDYFPGDFVTVEDFNGVRYNRQIVEVNVNVAPSENGLVVDKDVALNDE